jgi:hypothetical protein
MKVRVGNGRDCITVPAHGASLVMPSGREWCPHQTHDGAADRKVKPTTPWLDKQEAAADDSADRTQSA